MITALLLLAVVCLAYANGANDNFKGVATLFGSRTTNYRSALIWATLTTLLGSLTAAFLAEHLLKSFSGRGLVDHALTVQPDYAAAVGLAAGVTVLAATRIGMPISTTHSLVGALVGAGWAARSAIDVETLSAQFFLPLLASPLLAIGGTAICYRTLRWMRKRSGVTAETCICVGNEVVEVLPAAGLSVAIKRVEELSLTVGDEVTCERRYRGRVVGVDSAALLDRLHFISAGLVSYSRGLNDTPKVAALLLFVPAVGAVASTAAVGAFIAVGGLVAARKVAQTMSREITPMNHGQGFTANLITGLIVIAASRFGLPVSTTHVSCGGLFGIAAATGEGHLDVIGKILAAWVTTLPAAAALGAACYWAIAALA